MVKISMNPEFENEMSKQIAAKSQEAVDLVARQHHEQGAQDLEERLKAALADRGINITDESWLQQTAEQIRSSPVVVLVSESEIGAEAEDRDA